MKHLFVPYELAVIAKEKGFDEPCLFVYLSGEINFFRADPKRFPVNGDSSTSVIAAPIYNQLIDWFRNVHGIFVAEQLCWDEYDQPLFQYNIHNGHNPKIADYFCRSDKYEALNKALEEAFKLI